MLGGEAGAGRGGGAPITKEGPKLSLCPMPNCKKVALLSILTTKTLLQSDRCCLRIP